MTSLPHPRLPAARLRPGDRVAIRHLPGHRAFVVRKGGDGETALMAPAFIDVAIRELSRWRLASGHE